MKTKTIATRLGVLTACFVISGSVFAEDDCSGYNIEFGNAHVLIESDPSLPSHLAVGRSTRTGATSSQTTYVDKDRDHWTVVNEWRSGELQGTWYKISGTGKWENVKRSGWWKRVRDEGDVRISAWGGNCTWPDAGK
jgi:hypothetical protein